MKSWRPLTENELKSFLAIVFNMGLIRKSSIEEYWNSSLPSQASHWFKKVMSRNRFQNILKFLYVSDYSRNVPRQHPAYDPASRFRPLLSFMNKQFCRFIVPKKEVCVDETLMATKGHNVMRQYIPSKAAKFGIKFWMLCESATGYILQMSVYRGRHFDPVPAGQLQGTLRKNRPMPNTIRNANPTPDNPVYMRKGKMLCAAFRDMDGKKPVRMLSTAFSAQHLPSGRPRIVNGYNKNMGAVDTTDAIMKAYGGHRKNRKPWKKVVLHLFHRIVHNAYILYQKNTSDTPVKSRLRFIQEIVESLSGIRSEQPRRRRRHKRARSVSTLPDRKEKDCCVCSNRSHGGRKRSRTVCNFCKKGLHKDCVSLHEDCREL
ncbi:unnamed protein product [Mytilus edulis]|uniref:PiggyBac transposable element-derived protein domain-containing protein n=1 Tax=Mytilus edulis TaxID=6550 RepID=A0A8S3UP72_MYTED|nr:unnamed protein product [Mytilus edulis]